MAPLLPGISDRPDQVAAVSKAAKKSGRIAAEGLIAVESSGRTAAIVEVNAAPGQSILDVGLRHGVDLLFSCTLGGCGACMLQIAEGEVEYDDPDAICLTEDEIADGCCLACVGRPRGRLVLEA